MNNLLKKITLSENGKIAIAAIVGVAIGAVFYPSKRVEEKERQRYEERIQKEVEYSRNLTQKYEQRITETQGAYFKMEKELNGKIEKQSTEISKLKMRMSERTFKLVKPDGTIEERTFKESELSRDTQIVTTIREEYVTKIKQTEEKYKKVYSERLEEIKDKVASKLKEKDERIAELEKSKVTTVNPGNTRIGVGITNEKDYYGIVERDIFGPVFIHGLFEVNPQDKEQKGGLGIGIKF